MNIVDWILLEFLFVIIVIIPIYSLYLKWQDIKFERNHPEYFELKNELITVGNECFEWEDLISQKKKAIDIALAEEHYLTPPEVMENREKIIQWRNEIKELRNEYRPLKERHIILKEQYKKMCKELKIND